MPRRGCWWGIFSSCCGDSSYDEHTYEDDPSAGQLAVAARYQFESADIGRLNYRALALLARDRVKNEEIKNYELTQNESPDAYFTVNSRDGASARAGWKIHISIGDDSRIHEAWGIVMPLLLQHGVACFKVLDDSRAGEPGRQRGKEIVIYRDAGGRDDAVDWGRLLNEIEHGLGAARIPAGTAPRYRAADIGVLDDIAEPLVRGSAYLYAELGGMSESAIRRCCIQEQLGPFGDILIAASVAGEGAGAAPASEDVDRAGVGGGLGT